MKMVIVDKGDDDKHGSKNKKRRSWRYLKGVGNMTIDQCRSGLKVMTQEMSHIRSGIGAECRRGLSPVWTLLSMKGTVSKKEVGMEKPECQMREYWIVYRRGSTKSNNSPPAEVSMSGSGQH